MSFMTVNAALAEGLVVTLQLFFLTILGALPLGLVICFGSMNNWAPLGGAARRLNDKNGGETRFSRMLAGFKPISMVVKLIVWIVRGAYYLHN